MKTISGKTEPRHPALRGTPVNTKEIIGYEQINSAALVVGMVSSGLTFNIVSHLNGGPIDTFSLLLPTMGFVVLGGLVFGLPAFMISMTLRLRNQISKLNPGHKKVSLFSAFRMIAWFRPKETVLSLGTDDSGRLTQAFVTSSFNGTLLSEVREPEALELWDSSASEVASVYGIFKKTNRNIRVSS